MILQNAADALVVLDNYLAQVLQSFDKNEHKSESTAERAWLIKKGHTHPCEVHQQVLNLMQQSEIATDIKKYGADETKLEIIALLHDLGRLHEINPQSGKFQRIQDVQPCSHGDLSAQMLREAGEDDWEILLPVKYHDKYDCKKNLFADADYQKLPNVERERIYFMWRLLTDADRLGNFAVIAKIGLQGMSELFDNRLHSYAKISSEIQNAIMAGNFFSEGSFDWRQTYADVWVVIMDMITLLHFDYSRQVFIKNYLPQMKNFLFQELKQAPATEGERADAFAFLQRFYEKLNKEYIRF